MMETIDIPESAWESLTEMQRAVNAAAVDAQAAHDRFEEKRKVLSEAQTRLSSYARGLAAMAGISIDDYVIDGGRFVPRPEPVRYEVEARD